MYIKTKIHSFLSALAISVVGTTLLVSTTVSAVSGLVSGNVYCTWNSWNNIVGVWVNAASGTDGWADWNYLSNGLDAHWSRTLSQSTSSYSLHIGCGGTMQNWAHTFYMNGMTAKSGTNVFCAGSGCIYG